MTPHMGTFVGTIEKDSLEIIEYEPEKYLARLTVKESCEMKPKPKPKRIRFGARSEEELNAARRRLIAQGNAAFPRILPPKKPK